MKTAYEIKRFTTKTIENSIVEVNPSLKSVQSLPEDAREKINNLIHEYSSLMLDIQQSVMNLQIIDSDGEIRSEISI